MLNKKVTIYVPGTTGVNKPAPELQAQVVTDALTIFADYFGGSTAIAGRGAWISQEHGLVVEPVVLVYAYTDADGLARNLSAVKSFAVAVAGRMSQECVCVEVDGELHFISTEAQAEAA